MPDVGIYVPTPAADVQGTRSWLLASGRRPPGCTRVDPRPVGLRQPGIAALPGRARGDHAAREAGHQRPARHPPPARAAGEDGRHAGRAVRWPRDPGSGRRQPARRLRRRRDPLRAPRVAPGRARWRCCGSPGAACRSRTTVRTITSTSAPSVRSPCRPGGRRSGWAAAPIGARRVGRLADGYVGTSSGGPRGCAPPGRRCGRPPKRAGRDPASLKLAALVYACVDDDRDRAAERAGAYLRRYSPPARAQVRRGSCSARRRPASRPPRPTSTPARTC